jgi:hypothetical protein
MVILPSRALNESPSPSIQLLRLIYVCTEVVTGIRLPCHILLPCKSLTMGMHCCPVAIELLTHVYLSYSECDEHVDDVVFVYRVLVLSLKYDIDHHCLNAG